MADGRLNKHKNKIEAEIQNLSQEPGVYIFKDKNLRIIYIGKAINLKSRVRSYWNKSSWSDRPKLGIMVPKVSSIETIVTKSEKEALILESNLVFKHQPRYNVLLKDNKSFPWLMITYDESFPRLVAIRNIERFKKSQGKRAAKTKNKFFGPYTNVSAMYENLELVLELFPLRRKRVAPFKNRPCLNYDLGKCLGPCQGLISEEEYQIMLDQVELLLNGNFRDLKELLEVEMQRLSDNQEYEQAAKIRDRIYALETFNEKQNVISEDIKLDQDIFALVFDKVKLSESSMACLQVFKIRSGKLVNRDSMEIDLEDQDSEAEIFDSAFVQYYSQVPETELPKEILISSNLNTELLSDWLTERKGSKVTILYPKRGEKYEQVALARKNAKIVLEKIKLERLEESSKNINEALDNLQQQLSLNNTDHIECYDISHIQGTNVVASMVCFTEGMPDKAKYKRFKISVDQNDDFASMREVIARRFAAYKPVLNSTKLPETKLPKPEGLAITNENSCGTTDGTVQMDFEDLPNLIIIDGGKGQLSSAKAILDEYGLEHIKVVGLAKREEEIFLPGESKPIVLDRKSPELFLIQRIRNEAHRFAITYHRSLRSKKSLASLLDEIPGLGKVKKKLLLEKYPSLKKIKEAGVDKVQELQGFSKKLAQTIITAIS